jgi:septin family protein
MNFLRTALALPAKKRNAFRTHDEFDNQASPPNSSAGQKSFAGFTSQYLETEIDGERIGLTLWDSQGLERNMVDLQLREMSSFLESKFEDTFTEEMKVIRAPGVRDTHIHCAFLVLDPVRLDANIAAATAGANGTANGSNGHFLHASKIIGGLDEDLDVQVLRTLQGKTTVLPVISKADTVTTAHMTYLKKMVWDSLKKANLDPLEALGLDDFEGSTGSNRSSRLDEKDEDDEADDSDGNSSIIKRTIEAAAARQAEAQRIKAAAGGNQEDELNEMRPKRSSSGSLRKRIAESQAVAIDDPEQTPYLPLSIISPDSFDPGTVGRKFPWGFADPYNVDHCDFVRLKEAVFSEWRGELREASRELWYEGWRTSRLRKRRIL